MTALSPLGAHTQIALKEGTSWGDVVRASNLDAHADALPEVVAPVAKPVKLNDADKNALGNIASQLDAVVWPTSRRALNQVELRKAVEVLETGKDLAKLAKRVEDATKKVLFNHFDVHAERDPNNPAKSDQSPRNSAGYYALEDKTNGAVPGLEQKATREVSSATVALSAELLLELVLSGELPRETYLKMTEPARVISEPGVMEQIKNNPGLIPTLKKATVVTRAASVSLHLRKND